MARLLLLGNSLGNRGQNLDGEESDAVLVVGHEVLEEGYHLVNDDGSGHLLDELGEVSGRLAANHGRLIVDEQPELLAKLLLDRRRDLGVGSCEETAARHL